MPKIYDFINDLTYEHPINHTPDIITQDANNRFVTDVEKTTWNNKANGDHIHSELHAHTNKIILDAMEESFTTTLKNKLDILENYTHPSSHAPSIITQDENNRFVTDIEKTAWNNKAASDHTHTDLHAHTNKDSLDLITKDVSDNPLWNGSAWPSFGVSSWNDLTNKPTSSVIDIDDAVSKKHEHTNILILNATQESFTTVLKNKLDGLENYTHPESHAPSIITQDANNRFVSDTEKITWNSKATSDHTHTDLHTHTNKTILEGLTQSTTSSLLLYNGLPVVSSIPSLSMAALNSYTNDTWTTVYTNNKTYIETIYLSSITNRSDAAITVSLRLVNSSDEEIHTIILNHSLNAYTGIENSYSKYPIPIGAKVQFRASAANSDCILSIGEYLGIHNVAFLNTYTVDTWTDVFDNTGSDSYRLDLVSILNKSSNTGNVDLRVVDSTDTLVYYLVPPMTLTAGVGVENHTSYFVLGANQKIQYSASVSDTQILISLVKNTIPSGS